MIYQDGNETKTIYEAYLLEELKSSEVRSVTKFFDYLLSEGMGSDNGVDPRLDDFLVDELLRPLYESYIAGVSTK